MSKRVIITLLQTCMIAGLPRSPIEGAQEVDEAEAQRLVEAGMAELADIQPADDAGGGDLSENTVKQLREIAKVEGVEVASGADKAALIAAIEDHREERELAREELDGFDLAKLREIAEAGEVDIAADADEATIRDALMADRFPTGN